MADRYFVESPISGERALLAGQEAHHLAHVMRAKPGTEAVLFDGSGAEYAARVVKVGRADVELAILARREVNRELPVEFVLAVSLPKGERQKWLVEKAVELGVTRLVPLLAARSVAQPVEKALERLRRAVIEASKQCGRNRLMEIAEPQGWKGLVEATRDAPCRLLAHPGENKSGRWLATAPELVYAAIGAEGGFTDEEVRLALHSGWQPVDLGPRILRVETAAVFVAALVASRSCFCPPGGAQSGA